MHINTKITNSKTAFLNKSVIYQLFLRAFTQDGTFNSASKMLAYLRELGVDILYLCPCFSADDDENQEYWSPRQKLANTNNPKNPYRIKDYYSIDEEYGTEEDFANFIEKAHDYGFRVILDLVYFHCGPKAVFIDTHSDFVVRDEKGNIETGVWLFPKLNYESSELREYLWKNMCYYVEKFGIDGYRCDVGDAVPLDFWEEGRRRLEKIKPDIFMLNEGGNPASLKNAFDINYDFEWPEVLFNSMMSGRIHSCNDEKTKAEKEYTAKSVPEYWNKCVKRYSDEGADTCAVVRFADNHDYANDAYDNRKDAIAPPNVMTAMLAFCILLDGVPFIYNGVEIRDRARHSIFSGANYGRFCIDWSEALTDEGKKRFESVKRLIDIRHRYEEISEGETYWLKVSDEKSMCAFERRLGNYSTVVYANFTEKSLNAEIECGNALKIERLFINDSDCIYDKGILKCSILPYGCGAVRIKRD